MTPFERQPYEAQLAEIDRAARSGSAGSLLAVSASLPDPEPLTRVVAVLAREGARHEAAIAEVIARLPDPAVQHFFEAETIPVALRSRLAAHALRTWPLERPSALAFLVRWLKRHDEAAYDALVMEANAGTDGPPGDARWLLFVSGTRLAQLARQPDWAPVVISNVERIVDALARAPKSISQANAEDLLSRRVYADSGHFLFELLQNADDAGASRWSARIEEDRVLVTHDGAPFSFLDLVGVLSIGQTTKSATQIGFFGVGFKSVYEVCARPRIESGAFHVEIAHVSIPRVLERPHADEDTRVVLPFVEGVDPRALERKARRIPPETLLTLPHLESLTVETRAGTHSWIEVREDRDFVILRSDEETRRYRITEGLARFDGAREHGRVAKSPILVGVAIDSAGAPTPLRGDTLFAFLPTAMHTGLRVLVHARFDVTLDRERLELDSAWNDALLEEAGRTLARAVGEIAASGHSPLTILTEPAAASPAVAPLLRSLRESLRQVPCLPAALRFVAPVDARIVAADLGRALGDHDLGDGARALRPLDSREEAIARDLGATDFTSADLLGWLGDVLREGEPTPSWLGGAIHRALDDDALDLASLRRLPLLMADGRSTSAERARHAASPWARLYAGVRPLVDDAWLGALPPRLVARLGVPRFEASALVADLEDETLGPLLSGRQEALLDALSQASDALLDALRDIPLLPDEEGTLVPARALFRTPGWMPAALAERLGGFVEGAIALRHPELIVRWLPRFAWSDLADALESERPENERPKNERPKNERPQNECPQNERPQNERPQNERPQNERLHAAALRALLDANADALDRPSALRFARLPFFDDVHGRPRALLGDARAWAPTDDAWRSAIPGAPWLEDPDSPFVRALDPPRVGEAEIARALASGLLEPASHVDAMSLLASRGTALSRDVAHELATAPVWLDTDARASPADGLRRGSASTALEAIYAEGVRRRAHPMSVRLADALGLHELFGASDHALLVRDLARGVVSTDHPALPDALQEAATLAPAELAPLAEVSLFRDESGAARALGAWVTPPDPTRVHRVGSSRAWLRGVVPLLSEADEARYATLLDALGARTPTLSALIAFAPQLDASALREALRERESDALSDADRVALRGLPIFRARDGQSGLASSLAAGAPFDTLLEDASELDDALLLPEDAALAIDLGLALRPGAEVLRERLLSSVDADAPPPHARLHALAALCVALGVDPRSACLALDATGRLQPGPLLHGSAAERALATRTALARRLADSAWAEGATPGTLRTEITPRQLAEALREAFPRESEAALERDALTEWIAARGDALASDPAAVAALSSAAIFPSARGTLRAPREMVLRAPASHVETDLALDWGLDPSTPAATEQWLAATFPMDRHAQRAVIGHLLDGLQRAAEGDDRGRSALLLDYLALVLGAGEVDADALEERARREKVRARVRVPLTGGAWEKPRFAWMPGEDTGGAEEFAEELPPRIELPHLSEEARLLLIAAGARSELNAAALDELLEGRGLLPGAPPRRALAHHVVRRVQEAPALIDALGLRSRTWIPDRSDTLRRPSELLWPDALTETLDPTRLPHPAVFSDISAEVARRLGLGDADALQPSALRGSASRELSPDLLDFVEERLRQGRWKPAEVAAALEGEVLLRDDLGRLRPPRELTSEGSAELFGDWRGDFRSHPRVGRALGIPRRPDGAMITGFMVDIGRALDSLDASAMGELERLLPECLAQLDADAATLPMEAAVAALGDRVAVRRLGDPEVALLEPEGLAFALPAGAILDVMPNAPRAESLRDALLAAGVRDLWAMLEVTRVDAGLEVDALRARGEATRARLLPLGRSAPKRVAVVEELHVEGRIGEHPVHAALPAVLHEGTLWITPEVLDDLPQLAPILGAAPERRASMRRWLSRNDAPPHKAPVKPRAEATSVTKLWSRLKETFAPSEPRHEKKQDAQVGSRFFSGERAIRPQLAEIHGWSEDRQRPPDFGFAFLPARLPSPWLYAPKTIAFEFHPRAQVWQTGPFPRPTPSGQAGLLRMRGRLPAGVATLPVPHYARVDEIVAEDSAPGVHRGPCGETLLELSRAQEVRVAMTLGDLPRLDGARSASNSMLLAPTVPDEELPDEVHDFLADLDDAQSPAQTIADVRGFVQGRYRYDPSYLEDPAVGRWLLRVTRGRQSQAMATLHAGADGRHLGAGVCFELNVLTCELLRRAGIAAGVATGWVLDGGQIADPDHLWAMAFLEDPRGRPLWIPVDASTTDRGQPLRVPRRPPGKFRKPTRATSAAPEESWRMQRPRDASERKQKPAPQSPAPSDGWRFASEPRTKRLRKPKKRRPPRAEWTRVLTWLESLAGRSLTSEERSALLAALQDPNAAARLLARLRD